MCTLFCGATKQYIGHVVATFLSKFSENILEVEIAMAGGRRAWRLVLVSSEATLLTSCGIRPQDSNTQHGATPG